MGISKVSYNQKNYFWKQLRDRGGSGGGGIGTYLSNVWCKQHQTLLLIQELVHF